MNYVFISPAEIDSYFFMTVSFIGILITLVIAGFHLSYRNNPSSMKLRTRCIAGVLVLIGVASASYISNYKRFVSADITGEEVVLHFAGSFYKEVSLPKASIGAVEFGLPDRGVAACNITFVEKTTGRRYQSAFTKNRADTCKNLRLQIMQILAL